MLPGLSGDWGAAGKEEKRKACSQEFRFSSKRQETHREMCFSKTGQ